MLVPYAQHNKLLPIEVSLIYLDDKQSDVAGNTRLVYILLNVHKHDIPTWGATVEWLVESYGADMHHNAQDI
jgi:hypothetical protein